MKTLSLGLLLTLAAFAQAADPAPATEPAKVDPAVAPVAADAPQGTVFHIRDGAETMLHVGSGVQGVRAA